MASLTRYRCIAFTVVESELLECVRDTDGDIDCSCGLGRISFGTNAGTAMRRSSGRTILVNCEDGRVGFVFHKEN